MSFGFVTSETSGIPVVAFEGDVDGASIEPFEAAIIETATSADNCVIVDLQKVTYIDSQAFGRLLKAHINLEQIGGDVATSRASATSRGSSGFWAGTAFWACSTIETPRSHSSSRCSPTSMWHHLGSAACRA